MTSGDVPTTTSDRDLGKDYARVGAMALQAGDEATAIDALTTAIRLNPRQPDALLNLALIRTGRGELADAEALLRAALTERPGYPDALLTLGSVVRRRGRTEEAVELYRGLAARTPKDPRVWRNLATALSEAWRLDEAETAIKRALRLTPRDADALHSLAVILGRKCQTRAAVWHYRKAITQEPEHAWAHFNLAVSLLTLGNFEEGWLEYEWRFKTGVVQHHFHGRRWAGEPVSGKTVLLHCEQGFGDSIQFARFASTIAELGAKVILLVKPELSRLLATVPGVSAVFTDPANAPHYDFHLPMLSTPYVLGTRLETIPTSVPYLAAADSEVARWAERLRGWPGLRVGLVWAGGAHTHDHLASAIDRRRSIELSALEPLLALKQATFVSLQKGEASVQLETLPLSLRPFDAMSEVRDFADTAALIANFDLVISVDTSVAHLSAALGRPTWILSRSDGCWRWLENRDDSPWYPTVRIYRQTSPGDWKGVLARVADDLRSIAIMKNAAQTPPVLRHSTLA